MTSPAPLTRAIDGTVIIGAATIAPAGHILVGLRGAAVIFDPSRPGSPPRIEISNAEMASTGLAYLVGEAAASVARHLDEPTIATIGTDLDDRSVNVAAPPLAFSRVGNLLWLERYSPDPLCRALLEVETGTEVLELPDGVLDDDQLAAATLRLQANASRLAGWAKWLRTDAGPVERATLGALLERAVKATMTITAFDSPDHDDLEHELEMPVAFREFGIDAAADWTQLTRDADLGRLASRTPPGVVHAGADRAGIELAGRSSVDWLQLPAGILDSDESTVRWRMSSGMLFVEVDALSDDAPARSAPVPLSFRAYIDGDGRGPVSLGRLRLDRQRSVFRGTAPIFQVDRQTAPLLRVDVFDDGNLRPPRLGRSAAAAAASRWVARGLTALRLLIGGASTSSALPAIENALIMGESLFADALGSGPGALDGPAAAHIARQRASTQDLLRAALLLSDAPADRDYAIALRAEAGQFGDGRPAAGVEPDLSGGAWQLTVTERALLLGLELP